MIYVFENISEISDAEVAALYGAMPEERQARFNAYQRRADKVLCAASWAVLRFALLNECGIKNTPPIIISKNGKPSFVPQAESSPLPHFSISHCQVCVCIALAPQPVGADVEQISRFSRLLQKTCFLQQIFTPKEAAQILSLPQNARAEEACRLWTQKESIIKQVGSVARRQTLKAAAVEATALKRQNSSPVSFKLNDCMLSVYCPSGEVPWQIRIIDAKSLLK